MTDVVQQIKDRLNILDVVAPYVEVQKPASSLSVSVDSITKKLRRLIFHPSAGCITATAVVLVATCSLLLSD